LGQPRFLDRSAALPRLHRSGAMPRLALQPGARWLPSVLSERRLHRAAEALGEQAMSALLSGLALLVVFAMLVAALPIAYAAWRRIGAREADLQIWKMMRRRGISPSEAPSRQTELARAVRCCVL